MSPRLVPHPGNTQDAGLRAGILHLETDQTLFHVPGDDRERSGASYFPLKKSM